MQYHKATKDYQLALGNLTKQLKARKGDILNVKDFESPADGTAKLTQIWQDYSDLCAQSELFSSSLAGEQTKAKADLRLKEVAEYLLTIDYQPQLNSIELFGSTFTNDMCIAPFLSFEALTETAFILRPKRT